MKDRTNELRGLQKYVYKFEQATEEILLRNFKACYAKMDYIDKDMKDLVFQRMNIVSKKLVTNNKNLSASKEQAQNANFSTLRNVKQYGRKFDMRIDEVLSKNGFLMGKYDFLVNCNNYVAKLAEQLITITELSSCLLRSDEKDKGNICLMGSKGSKSLKDQQMDHHHKRMQLKL